VIDSCQTPFQKLLAAKTDTALPRTSCQVEGSVAWLGCKRRGGLIAPRTLGTPRQAPPLHETDGWASTHALEASGLDKVGQPEHGNLVSAKDVCIYVCIPYKADIEACKVMDRRWRFRALEYCIYIPATGRIEARVGLDSFALLFGGLDFGVCYSQSLDR